MGIESGDYDYEELSDSTTSFNGFFIGGTVAAALIGGTTVGAVVLGVLSGGKMTTSTAAAYGFFVTLMGITFISSYNILWTIVDSTPQEIQGGVSIVVGLFIAITAVMFLIGLMQLIVGGIEQYT